MGSSTHSISLDVNGRERKVVVDPTTPLLYVLRNDLALTAAKFGCGLGQCYACAVLIDGEVKTSCTVEIGSAARCEIVSPEGINNPKLRDAFVAETAAQCGYCLPGMIVAAEGLLMKHPSPSDADIREALSPHLCRCGTHPRILRAIRKALA